MGRKLSGLQLAILRVLWERGHATVAVVQEALQPDRDLAYSTLATMLSRMEQKGVVRHKVTGRTFVYEPVLSEDQVSESTLSNLIEHVFSGKPSELVMHLLQSQEVDSDELARIRDLIDEHDAGRQKPASKGKRRGR